MLICYIARVDKSVGLKHLSEEDHRKIYDFLLKADLGRPLVLPRSYQRDINEIISLHRLFFVAGDDFARDQGSPNFCFFNLLGFHEARNSETSQPMVFQGNTDDSTVVRISLKRPIIARVLRFRPLNKKQHGYACMRVEMYGCDAKQDERFSDCSIPVGMEDNRIQTKQVTASSYSQSHLPSYARLNIKMKEFTYDNF
ncbi:hypothetical protein QZH41_001632 [Actinostola sp. cb2023]|nr:hypothetical protein QZH41_001632 [Actinostola sp. cb2023]